MSALLIIDVQNDFTRGSLSLEKGPSKAKLDPIIERINGLINNNHFNIIVYTKDYHPEDHCSFELWPKHCIAGTWGSELDDRLQQNPTKQNCDEWFIIRKGYNKSVDSYSAFIDNDRREETGLRKRLSDNNIRQNIIVGLALDYCVYHTALDSTKYGFETIVLEDCTASYDSFDANYHNKIDNLKQNGVRFKQSTDF